MKKLSITKLSTKGQIVIPKEMRKDLEPGTPFIVLRDGTRIVLQKLPVEKAAKELEKILKKTLKIPEKTGLKPIDVVRTTRIVKKELWKE